ncbi:izumo sperm-egg fusion protein 1 [Sceloporus undulatus]|uniref:izumo sperm-egg fusion protein 1 n=1 Tax=Sceloporus undulatus TaxID=8520 RepID=UPI001C4A9629|nr:izumo sperm-egg fusion protein 1 [Sceloporus undulatus]
MSWLVFWLIAQMIAGSHSCLKCSKDAMALKDEFKNEFLERKLRAEPDLKKKLQELVDNTIEGLSHQRIDPEKYMAMIDETTLGILATHFKRSMNRIMENDFEDGQLFNEVNWSLQKLTTTFQEIMPAITKLHCSNECGVMMYVSINCFNCVTRSHSCNKGIYCGERRIQVEMDEDLILDCALRWHKASHGMKMYRFYRVVNGKQQVMTTGKDSFLVKKEANSNDTGRYRCEMLDPEGDPASRLEFHVVVLPPVGKTTWFTRPHITMMEGSLALGVSSRAPPPQEDWTAWIVIGSTGGVLFLVVAGFVFYYRRKNKEDEEEDEEEDKESESESSEMVEM